MHKDCTRGKSANSGVSTSTTECDGTEIIPWNVTVLPEILTKPRNDTSASISASIERGFLGMDEEGRSCFPKGQVPLGLLLTTGTIWS